MSLKKQLISIVCVASLISFSACGQKKTSDNIISNEAVNEITTEETTEIIVNDVPEGSEAAIKVKETVANYLDTFISCDFDAIREVLHPDDSWMFNFESEDQLRFYEAIFPQIKYEFEYVSEYEGVYGVMTQITSPSMIEVYGSIITDYLDRYAEQDIQSVNEIVSTDTERMLEMIVSPDLERRVEKLYIYVEYIDGEYIPRCDAFLANEITGGAPEASDEITSVLNETINALDEQ